MTFSQNIDSHLQTAFPLLGKTLSCSTFQMTDILIFTMMILHLLIEFKWTENSLQGQEGFDYRNNNIIIMVFNCVSFDFKNPITTPMSTVSSVPTKKTDKKTSE